MLLSFDLVQQGIAITDVHETVAVMFLKIRQSMKNKQK